MPFVFVQYYFILLRSDNVKSLIFSVSKSIWKFRCNVCFTSAAIRESIPNLVSVVDSSTVSEIVWRNIKCTEHLFFLCITISLVVRVGKFWFKFTLSDYKWRVSLSLSKSGGYKTLQNVSYLKFWGPVVSSFLAYQYANMQCWQNFYLSRKNKIFLYSIYRNVFY